MNCFQHRETVAVGTCKACAKAVCADCAQDTGRGLACSEKCAEEVSMQNEIIDRSKLIYGIGETSRLPPTSIIIYGGFSLLFIGFGMYPVFIGKGVEWFLLAMGFGFAAITVLAYFRTRKLKLNC